MTKSNGPSRSEVARGQLDHPVIDGDGHMIEVEPVLLEYMKQVGGQSLVDDYVKWCETRWRRWYEASPETRRAAHIQRTTYWGFPTGNTTDRVTCMLPGLMHARMDKLGIDLAIAYPTIGALFLGQPKPDVRRGLVRSINLMNADLYRTYGDRLIPVAAIPMNTPQEAVEELDFAVGELGFKAVMLQGAVRRAVPEAYSGVGRFGNSYYMDHLAMDSEYDYDPVWQRCLDHKVAVTTHSGAQGLPNRTSPSSFVFNHVGHFAQHHEGMCKAFLLGGVMRRFPDLRVAFLEGGVGWAVSLYNQIFEHWEKRNVDAMRKNLDPALVDRNLVVKFFESHGDDIHKKHLAEMKEHDGHFFTQWDEKADELDEFRASGIRSKEDIRKPFADRFYFGCEADDRMIPWAFDTNLNRMGARLKAIFSSDIGHWDVIDATECLAESYELMEHGFISAEDMRDFTFTNSVELHGSTNPDFFKGTVIEGPAREVLEADQRVAAE